VNHNVRNVSIINEGFTNKVVCAIDSLDVEISANNRTELCFLAFLEDLSNLIGKNHLLKRSMLFIRAWWYYETANYVKTQIKHYLSDFSLCMMIVSVFNRYSEAITTPFLALLFFLREFSSYDGRLQVISLQGLLSFQSETSNQPFLRLPQPSHLISLEMMEKYWKLFNLNDPLNAETPSGLFLFPFSLFSYPASSLPPLSSSFFV
jgi:hypothetical protein